MSNEKYKYTNKDGVETEYIPTSESEIGIPYFVISGPVKIITTGPSTHYKRKNYKVKPEDTRVP